MVTIREMGRRLDKAISAFDSDVEAILRILEQEIIELNREEQLFKEGVGTDGNILGVYSKTTEEMTQGVSGVGFPKKAGEPFNFYDTGSAFKSFGLRPGEDSFSIFSTSQTLKKFSETKGIPMDMIIGLTDKNRNIVEFEKIKPLLRDFVTRRINGL